MTLRKIFLGFILFSSLSGYSNTKINVLYPDSTIEEVQNKTQKLKEKLHIELNVETISSTGQFAPFWSFQNRNGWYGYEKNGIHTHLLGSYKLKLSTKDELKLGLGIGLTSNRYPKAFVNQWFGEYKNPYLSIWAGAKPYEPLNEDIAFSSISSGDISVSKNAPPIPSIGFRTNNYIPIPYTSQLLSFAIDFTAGKFFENQFIDYVKNESKSYVKDILFHSKSFYLKIGSLSKPLPLSFTVGGLHAVQWGGYAAYSEKEMPHKFKDFLRVVMGSSGGKSATTSDQINALGNQFGNYFISLDYANDWAKFRLFHEHYFEDKSGIEFNNGMDGLWGLNISPKHLSFIQNITLEYLTTLNQSGPFHIIRFSRPNGIEGRGGGGDSYYNNGEYRMGLIYQGYNLGSPLLLSPMYNKQTPFMDGFQNNRLEAFHIGLKGQYKKIHLEYILKASMINSRGTSGTVYDKIKKGYAFYGKLIYRSPKRKNIDLYMHLGSDFGTIIPETLGGGVGMNYKF